MKHTDALANLGRLAQTRLTSSARAVYFVLATYTDDNGLCWPAVDTIGAGAGMNAANVRRHLAALVAAGLIAVEHGNGRGNTNLYRLTVDVVHIPRGSARVSGDETRADLARNPRGSSSKPARIRATNVFLNDLRTGAPAPPDPHDAHRPGDCAECDAGRATIAARLQIS